MLRRPIDQPLALLFDDGRRRVLHERVAAELALRLGDFHRDSLDLLVQAHALRVQVDEPFQRHQQAQVTDHGGSGRRGVGVDRHQVDALDAVEEAQLRIEACNACQRVGAATDDEQRDEFGGRDVELTAHPTQRRDHRLQPFDVGFAACIRAGN